MRLTVDQQRCIGSGQCVMAAPDVFGQCEEEGHVLLRDPGPAEERRAAVSRAATGCPVQAITISQK
ncbi:ferredoxin [Streptosporangium pseudovulgare]|uniref:Ferredoxin n=1 Tax=Streptosporangium pseudovulgare TaxID=35765 RepID=A0ABQ2RB81_9ACTN|nr:ferredoxin [Streptosporangium pseudovulgare]GGQ19517.1 ferredoxin [Streptosporangium pseudovulgare]